MAWHDVTNSDQILYDWSLWVKGFQLVQVLWLSKGTWTDEMVAGRFIGSIHQNASTACSCTMFPSTGPIVEPCSKGTEGLPCDQGIRLTPWCDLTTQSCPQHHNTNCDSLLLLVFSSKTFTAFVTACLVRNGGIACLFLFITVLIYEKYVFLWLKCSEKEWPHLCIVTQKNAQLKAVSWYRSGLLLCL